MESKRTVLPNRKSLGNFKNVRYRQVSVVGRCSLRQVLLYHFNIFNLLPAQILQPTITHISTEYIEIHYVHLATWQYIKLTIATSGNNGHFVS